MHRNTGLIPPVIITDRPKAGFCCGFICFMFGAVQFSNVSILILLCVLLFNLCRRLNHIGQGSCIIVLMQLLDSI